MIAYQFPKLQISVQISHLTNDFSSGVLNSVMTVTQGSYNMWTCFNITFRCVAANSVRNWSIVASSPISFAFLESKFINITFNKAREIQLTNESIWRKMQ